MYSRVTGLDLQMSSKTKYATVSLPKGLTDEIDALIEELGFWPSRGAFVREATLVKIRDEQNRLLELREIREPKEAD